MIRLDASICRNPEESARREWLETNGLGGFASSTVSGINTRRYHGLLVAATKPPVGRMVLLSKFEETLIVDGRRYELSANRYPGVTYPRGYEFLEEYSQDPFPTFRFRVEGCELEKCIFMARGSNTTIVRYTLRGAGSLELRPLIAFRDFHNTTHANGALNGALAVEPNVVAISPYQDCPTLYLSHNGAQVDRTGNWYRNFEYDIERDRGLDYREDLFNPCVLTFDRGRADLIASTERVPIETVDELQTAQITARKWGGPPGPRGSPRTRSSVVPAADLTRSALTAAADQYLVRRGDQTSVIAGYHWFSDWGRDTMIALPGLTLSTGRPDTAKSILLEFARHVDRGMLPNRFPDAGETPEYNTVDATLWFFEAARALAAATGDLDFVSSNLYDTLRGIISWHERGTRYGIQVDSDGLLHAGEPGVQLTWMDAKVGDWVVTPRSGKPVEIQALWYNALRIMEEFATARHLESDRQHYAELAGKARQSFTAKFWNPAQNCLYDVIDGDRRDASIRPNQIFAVSLEHQVLPPDQARSVVDTVERHLLTPYGLRSLAPSDPAYRGHYEGDPLHRDSAYHQGTVWPWLLGPFLRAYLRVSNNSAAAQSRAWEWTADLRRYLEGPGMGQIPEIFDGDAPHRPGGCIAQAWSVAELLRFCAEDIHNTASSEAESSQLSAFQTY